MIRAIVWSSGESDALGCTRRYSYDTQGNARPPRRQNGEVTLRAFDKVGRLLRSQFPDGTANTYTSPWLAIC